MKEEISFKTSNGVKAALVVVVSSLILNLVAVVWGAATMRSEVNQLNDFRREFRAEFRTMVTEFYDARADLRVIEQRLDVLERNVEID